LLAARAPTWTPLWVIEGVGTYGARIARAAGDAGYCVIEAARMNARANRGVGKSDPLDARRIAQAVLPLEPAQLRRPRKDDGVRAALRILIASRDHISTERTAAINALIALLRVIDLGLDARGTLTATQITAIAAWRIASPLRGKITDSDMRELEKLVDTLGAA